MKTLCLFMLVCLVCIFTFSAYAGEKVAVLDFKSILAPERKVMNGKEFLRLMFPKVGLPIEYLRLIFIPTQNNPKQYGLLLSGLTIVKQAVLREIGSWLDT